MPLIGGTEFARQLLAMREFYGISDVLIQTEAQDAVDQFGQWCAKVGLRLHYTLNVRPGLDIFSSKFGPAGANMTEEGRISVLNLLVGSRAFAIVGSLHSAWLKIAPAFMIARQWKAVLVVGLAEQDHWGADSYTGPEAPAQQLLRLGEVFRPTVPAPGGGRFAPSSATAALFGMHPGLVH